MNSTHASHPLMEICDVHTQLSYNPQLKLDLLKNVLNTCKIQLSAKYFNSNVLEENRFIYNNIMVTQLTYYSQGRAQVSHQRDSKNSLDKTIKNLFCYLTYPLDHCPPPEQKSSVRH